jgi:hypothetical protein
MDTIEAISSSNDSAVKYVTLLQERVLDGWRTLADSLQNDTAPALTTWIPGGQPDRSREVVEEAYSLNARLLEANKEFAFGLLDVFSSVPNGTKATKKR